MDFLQHSLEQIRQTLAALSQTARVAMALLAVLIALAMVMLISYARKPAVTAVFNSPLAGAELGQAEQALRRERMDVRVVEGRLMVPLADKERAYALLAYENLLPSDSVSAFEELASQDSLWRTQDQNAYIRKQVKQTVLSRMISSFPGVRQAVVIIEEGTPRRLGTPGTRPTASVQVSFTRQAEVSRRLIAAIADTVAGSVPDMRRDDVRIVDATNGRPHRIGEEDDLAHGRLEDLSNIESHYNRKIREHLQYINGVIVTTHAVPDPLRSREELIEEYDPDRVAVGVISSEMESVTGGGSAVGGQPGAVSNMGASIDMLSAGTSSEERMLENTEVRFPRTVVKNHYTGRVTEEISASVNVPRQYLLGVYRQVLGVDPADEAVFNDFIQTHLERIQGQVMNIIGVDDRRLVQVDWYLDSAGEPLIEPAQAGVGQTVFLYGKPAAVGGLVLVALMMVLMIARRRMPGPLHPEPVGALGGLLDATIGADSEDGALPGIELDDETIQSQRVIEQVSQMIKQKPESAANLIRRWTRKN